MSNNNSLPPANKPKIFGLRFDQMVSILISFIVGTQLYSWMMPIEFGGIDFKLVIVLLFIAVGPIYCIATRKEEPDFERIWPGKKPHQ